MVVDAVHVGINRHQRVLAVFAIFKFVPFFILAMMEGTNKMVCGCVAFILALFVYYFLPVIIVVSTNVLRRGRRGRIESEEK